MSAFVVEDKVINRVIGHLASLDNHSAPVNILRDEQGIDIRSTEDQISLGAAMFALNCNAVEQRYGTGEAKTFRDLNYSYRIEVELTTSVQAYKSLRCWLYQCSEGDVPDTSLLFATMERVASIIAEEIVIHLAEFEKAEW